MAAGVKHRFRLFSKASALLCRAYVPYMPIRTFSKDVKEYDFEDIMTGSEMPLLFPPQVIRKGFEVHQSPRVFALRPDEKMIWLTKTFLTKGLPVEFEDLERNEIAIGMIKDCLHQVAAYQRSANKSSLTFHEEEFSLGLLQQMLQVAFMTGPPVSQDLFVHRKPTIEANWFRNFVFFNAKYSPSLVIRTRDPLQALKSTFPLPLGILSTFPSIT